MHATLRTVTALAALLGAACTEPADDTPTSADRDADGRMTDEAVQAWHEQQGRLTGVNFIPSTAVNELEMWQDETYDPTTIDRELGWAQDAGFNTVRVFLHDKLWTADPGAFTARIDDFLTIADRHHVKTILVIFDNVWVATSALGPQPEPVPGVHNSRWVKSPELAEIWDFPDQPDVQARLEAYAKGVITAFADDPRVVMWDLFNEPGSPPTFELAGPLLEASFRWGREIGPSQPLTAGVWLGHTTWDLSLRQLALSDVPSFHLYATADALETTLASLEGVTDRPLVCTEYMARTLDSTFQSNLPVFDRHDVGAISWGLVSGRTQTIYPWGSTEGAPEPAVWFHDVFRADGTPFSEAEVAFLRARAPAL